MPGLSLRTEAAMGHIFKVLMNNLGSMSIMTRNGYIPVFWTNKKSICNTCVKRCRTRGMVCPPQETMANPIGQKRDKH